MGAGAERAGAADAGRELRWDVAVAAVDGGRAVVDGGRAVVDGGREGAGAEAGRDVRGAVDIGREEAGGAGEGVARAAARVNGRDVVLLVDAFDAEDAERDGKAR